MKNGFLDTERRLLMMEKDCNRAGELDDCVCTPLYASFDMIGRRSSRGHPGGSQR